MKSVQECGNEVNLVHNYNENRHMNKEGCLIPRIIDRIMYTIKQRYLAVLFILISTIGAIIHSVRRSTL